LPILFFLSHAWPYYIENGTWTPLYARRAGYAS